MRRNRSAERIMKLVRLLSCYTLSLSLSWLHGTLRINLDLHLRQSLFACLSASFCFHKGFQTLVRRFSMRFVFFVASVSQHVSSMLLGWSLSVCLERNECATAIFISAFQGSSNPRQISFRRYDHLCGLLCDQLLTQDVFGGKFREAFWMSFCMGSVQVTQVDLLPWKTWLVSMSSCSWPDQKLSRMPGRKKTWS